MQKCLDQLLNFLKNKNQIVCYGAGEYGKETLCFLRDQKIKVDAFVVSHGQNNCGNILGMPIYEIDKFCFKKKCAVVLSMSLNYQKEVLINLKSYGIIDFFPITNKVLNAIRRNVIKNNIELKNIAGEKRCFILGMGPSIKRQNLTLLNNEIVFSCSWCTLLDSYNEIDPQFFISPAFSNDNLGDKYIKESLQYLDQNITSNTVILDYFDKPYVQYYKLFRTKKIYYIYQFGKWNPKRKKLYSLIEKTPKIQTATIMLLKVAMYLGFKKIYLIGTEHDLVKKKYSHAYEEKNFKGRKFTYLKKIIFSNIKNVLKWPNRLILGVTLNMYEEYHYLNKVAKANNIEIYNATNGGDLDEFDRVDFKQLFE